MAELLAKEPLFSGKTEFDQLDKVFLCNTQQFHYYPYSNAVYLL